MHAIAGPFGLDHPTDRTERGLGGVVDAEQGSGLTENPPGRHVDDVAVTAFDHSRCQSADEPQRRVVVQRHGAFDIVPTVQGLSQWSANRASGVIDKDVHPAETVFHDCGQFVHSIQIGQIAGERGGGAAGPGDAFR